MQVFAYTLCKASEKFYKKIDYNEKSTMIFSIQVLAFLANPKVRGLLHSSHIYISWHTQFLIILKHQSLSKIKFMHFRPHGASVWTCLWMSNLYETHIYILIYVCNKHCLTIADQPKLLDH